MKLHLKNNFLASLFLAAVLLSVSFILKEDEKPGNTDDTLTKIIIGKSIAGNLAIGIGWNEATCLQGRWPKNEFSDDVWDRYFGLMEWSGCHWLRHAVTISDWEPVNDNSDPEKTDWKKFDFDSEKMQRHYTFFDQAEKRGIKVLVTNWGMGADWLTSQKADPSKAHPDNEEEFAEAMAALIYHLKVNKKYSCIWALSLWNEPNGDWSYKGPKSNYPESFWPLYGKVDTRLKRLGVRDEILMLGPDASTGGNPEHIHGMLAKYGSMLDIICDHDYSAYRGEKMDKSIAAYRKLIKDLKKVPGKNLPFVIGEFGNYGAGSQAVDDDIRVYDGALSTTAYLFQMLNIGASGLARWEFQIYNNTWRNFGALTETDKDYIFKPYGPVFYIHAITARYVRPGWDVLETSIEGMSKGIFTTALSSAEGDITIMLLNDNTDPVEILIKAEISPGHSILHHLSVTGPMPEGIELHDNIRPDGNEIRLTLPARSVSALTSLPAGDLKIPGKLSLKR